MWVEQRGRTHGQPCWAPAQVSRRAGLPAGHWRALMHLHRALLSCECLLLVRCCCYWPHRVRASAHLFKQQPCTCNLCRMFCGPSVSHVGPHTKPPALHLHPSFLVAVCADRPLRFPVGQARLEAIGVLACACIMSVASFEVIQGSVSPLVATYTTGPKPQLERRTLLLSCSCADHPPQSPPTAPPPPPPTHPPPTFLPSRSGSQWVRLA